MYMYVSFSMYFYNRDQKAGGDMRRQGPLPEASSAIEIEGSGTNSHGLSVSKPVVASDHPSVGHVISSSGTFTVSSPDMGITATNQPDIKSDLSKLPINPAGTPVAGAVEVSNECNNSGLPQPLTDAPTSKTTTASTCDCTTANTEATTSSSAAKGDSETTSETPPEDDDLFPSAPPGESEESVASISIFFMTVLLGQFTSI